MEHSLKQLQDGVLAAAASKSALNITAGNSKSFYGELCRGEALDVTAHSGIVSYEPTELVMTAKCGTPLAVIEAALAECQQSLAFEPPNFNGAATFGGMVAAGLSGPARAAAGSVRDFVLGTQLLDGRGQILNFGGVVMKNVAGYDVSRLLAGSMGALGIITQASIKVWPMPKANAYLQFELPLAPAIEQLNRWGGKPLPINASCYHKGVLTVRLSGAQAAIDAAVQTMGGVSVQADELFQSLRHQTHAFFKPQAGRVLMRLSLPQAAAPLGIDGEVLVEWGGALRWIHTNDIAGTRSKAIAAGGHATVWRNHEAGAESVLTPLDAVSASIHSRLKAEFDPHALFNRTVSV
jgi:glycolate oxidase FAD binding subunit